jgi:hypothetical protein
MRCSTTPASWSSVLLGLAFLSLAVLLSVLARDRTRASGLAIATWFFFVLVFDLLLLGLLVPPAAVWRRRLCLAAAAQPGGRVPHPQRVLAGRRAHPVRPGHRRAPSWATLTMGGVMLPGSSAAGRGHLEIQR